MRTDWRQLRIRVLLVLVLLALGWVFYFMNSLDIGGWDWHKTYHPLIESYLGGKSDLYDGSIFGWYNPPWLVPLLLPFGLWSEDAGLTVLRVIALLTFAWSAKSLGSWRGTQVALLAPVLASVPVWDTFIAGNIDFIVMAGIVVAWKGIGGRNAWLAGLGLVLAFTKPQLGLVPMLVLVPELVKWSWGMRVKLLVAPAGALALSAFISGLDWPLRLWRVLQGDATLMDGWNVSVPHAFSMLAQSLALPTWPFLVAITLAGLLALAYSWREKDLPLRLAIGMALGPVISPYASSGSISILMSGAWPRLQEQGRPWIAGLAYLLQLATFSRTFWGLGAEGIALPAFAIVLLVGLLLPPAAKSPGTSAVEAPKMNLLAGAES